MAIRLAGIHLTGIHAFVFLIDQVSDQRRPARLVISSKPGARFSVVIFMKAAIGLPLIFDGLDQIRA